jgi:hypothetical protein
MLLAACGPAAAVAPPAPIDEPAAEIHSDRYGAQHTIELRLPESAVRNAQDARHIVAELTSLRDDALKVTLSGQRLPDGRLQYIVFVNPAAVALYHLSITDRGPFTPRRLYEGSLRDIPIAPPQR